MEKNGASWEQVHRILFPGGPVPQSLMNPNQVNGALSAAIPGAGILGPRPSNAPSSSSSSSSSASSTTTSAAPPGFGLQQQNASTFQPLTSPSANPMLGPATPLKDGAPGLYFGLPPPAPRDPKLLHYIKLFAAFVAKFGPDNEAVVRAKHQGRPEFCFLFGGEPGSEASIGSIFYEWQKEVIIKVLDAMKGLAQGEIPPDRIKCMRRELEQSINGGTPLKDLRLEAILGFPEGKLDWQKIAWELGVTLPGDKRPSQAQQLEPSEKQPEKIINPGIIKSNGDLPHEHTRARVKPERNEDSSPGSRRRRNRSRSRSLDRGRQRYRSRSRSRSPPRRSPRRSRRSYSRSPPRRRSSPPPPPRRMTREVEDARPSPYGNHQNHQQFHQLGPPVHSQQLAPPVHSQEHGFMNSSFGRFMAPVLDGQASVSPPPPLPHMPQELRIPGGFSSPFQPPPLPELPVQQQQLLLQQLQFPSMSTQAPVQMPTLGTLAPNVWPSPEVQRHQQLAASGGDSHQKLLSPPPPPMIAPLFPGNQPQQQQLVGNGGDPRQKFFSPPPPPPPPQVMAPGFPGAQPQQQQQVTMSREKYDRLRPASPPNDVEMGVASSSPKNNSEEDEARKSRDEESGRGSDKEKDSRALKIVRNTVAEFVKELLTPKWKDGILSKDDFKVIAQKAVNKVVGNLQGSQIPKGSDRVDRFMTSSREKITKLVQDYVEKHTKNAPAPGTSTAEAPA